MLANFICHSINRVSSARSHATILATSDDCAREAMSSAPGVIADVLTDGRGEGMSPHLNSVSHLN